MMNRKTAQEMVPTRRIYTENGSHIVPQFKSRWSNYRKLNWIASSIMAEHPGVRLYISKGRSWTGGRFDYGLFSLSYNNGGMSSVSYETLANILNGVDLGLRLAEHKRPTE